MKISKPDGTFIYIDENDSEHLFRNNDSTISIVLSDQATCVPGICEAELQLINSDESVSTRKFNIVVKKSVVSGQEIESAIESNIVEKMIKHLIDFANPHKVNKEQVGLGNVLNVSTNDQTPTYEEVAELENITSGETLSTAFGKIKKAIGALINHIATDSTTEQKGHTKLTDSISSTSINTAATPNSVKQAYDKACDVESTINDNREVWEDKYTKTEVDDKISELMSSIDLNESSITFDSVDTSDEEVSAWISVDKLSSGELMSSILNKISGMFQNIRYLNKAHDYNRDEDITEYYYSSLEGTIIGIDDGSITEGIYQKSKGKNPYSTTKELLSALMTNMAAFYQYFTYYVNPKLSKKQDSNTAINTSNISEQSVAHAAESDSATTAEKLNSSAGSMTQPVYFKDGKPVAGKYTLKDACARDVKTATAVTDSGYGTNNDKVPDLAFLAFWNGAFNNAGRSNLAYCKHGAFGTMATKGTSDYLPSTGGTLNGGLVLTNGNIVVNHASKNSSVEVYYGTTNKGMLSVTDAGNFGLRDITNDCYLLVRNVDDATVNIATSSNYGGIYIGNSNSSIEIRGTIYTDGLIQGNNNWLRSTALDVSSGRYLDIRLLGINSANNIHMGDYGTTKASPVFLHAEGSQYNFHKTSFRPNTTNVSSLGTSGCLWTTVYAKTGTINTSDRTKKHDINDLTDAYEQLFLKLQPKSFIFNDGDRVHIGAISQDVEAAMQELGIEPEQFAGFCKDIRYEYTEFNEEDGMPIEASKVPCKDEDGNVVYDYALRYQEFIFLTIHMVQKLYSRVEALEEENKKLWEKMEQLEDRLAALEK